MPLLRVIAWRVTVLPRFDKGISRISNFALLIGAPSDVESRPRMVIRRLYGTVTLVPRRPLTRAVSFARAVARCPFGVVAFAFEMWTARGAYMVVVLLAASVMRNDTGYIPLARARVSIASEPALLCGQAANPENAHSAEKLWVATSVSPTMAAIDATPDS